MSVATSSSVVLVEDVVSVERRPGGRATVEGASSLAGHRNNNNDNITVADTVARNSIVLAVRFGFRDNVMNLLSWR